MPRCDHRVVRVLFLMLTSAPCGCLAPRASVHYAQYLAELPDMSGKTVVSRAPAGLGRHGALARQEGRGRARLNRAAARADAAADRRRGAGAAPQQSRATWRLRGVPGRADGRAPRRGVDALCCNAGVMRQPDRAPTATTSPSRDGSRFLLAARQPLLDRRRRGAAAGARRVHVERVRVRPPRSARGSFRAPAGAWAGRPRATRGTTRASSPTSSSRPRWTSGSARGGAASRRWRARPASAARTCTSTSRRSSGPASPPTCRRCPRRRTARSPN